MRSLSLPLLFLLFASCRVSCSIDQDENEDPSIRASGIDPILNCGLMHSDALLDPLCLCTYEDDYAYELVVLDQGDCKKVPLAR